MVFGERGSTKHREGDLLHLLFLRRDRAIAVCIQFRYLLCHPPNSKPIAYHATLYTVIEIYYALTIGYLGEQVPTENVLK